MGLLIQVQLVQVQLVQVQVALLLFPTRVNRFLGEVYCCLELLPPREELQKKKWYHIFLGTNYLEFVCAFLFCFPVGWGLDYQ